MPGWNDYGSAEVRALRGISQRSEKPNRDLEKNVQNLNQSVRYMGQMMTIMQNGIDEANMDILQQIQSAIEDILIIFGLAGGDTLSFDWGDLDVVLKNLKQIFRLDLFNVPFADLDFFAIGDSIWNLLFGWISIDANFDDLLLAFQGKYEGGNPVLNAIEGIVGTFGAVFTGGGLFNLGQLTGGPVNLISFDGQFDIPETVKIGEGWYHDAVFGRTNPGSARFNAAESIGGVLSPPTPARVEPGKKYTPSAWAKWDGVLTTGTISVDVKWYRSDRTEIATETAGTLQIAGAGDWKEISSELTAPSGAYWAATFINVGGDVPEGNVWWDDVALYSKAQSLPQLFIENLPQDLQNLFGWIENLVDQLLGVFGLGGTGSLLDKIFDLTDEFNGWFGDSQILQGGFDDLVGNLLNNPAAVIGSIPQNLVSGLQSALSGVNGYIQDLVNAILRAIRKVPVVGGTIADIISEVGGLNDRADDAKATANQAQLDASAALANVAALQAAAVATQAWVSNLNDVVTVPRALLIPLPIDLADGGDGDGSYSGVHAHGSVLPFYKPLANSSFGNSTGSVYFTPIVSDRNGTAKKLRFITGPDSFAFKIDEYWLALYSFDTATKNLSQIWASSNLKDAIGSDRSEVELTIPDVPLVPSSIVFVGHMQRQPSLGGSTRNVAAVPQGGITRPASVLLRASCYQLTRQTAMPTSVNLDSLTFDNNYIPWYALSVDS